MSYFTEHFLLTMVHAASIKVLQRKLQMFYAHSFVKLMWAFRYNHL